MSLQLVDDLMRLIDVRSACRACHMQGMMAYVPRCGAMVGNPTPGSGERHLNSQVVRETGISRKTVGKMLDHPHPQPYGPRTRRYPKLGPHTASIQRMLRENATLPPRPGSPSRPSTSTSATRRASAAAIVR